MESKKGATNLGYILVMVFFILIIILFGSLILSGNVALTGLTTSSLERGIVIPLLFVLLIIIVLIGIIVIKKRN